MDSILNFWHQMTANPLLFIAVTLTLGVILVNGWTDACEHVSECVGSVIMKYLMLKHSARSPRAL